MEPPAVSTCSSTSKMGSSTNVNEKSRRSTAEYLQIDPSSTFISNSNRTFEDLPENFLETISPQQSSAPTSAAMMSDHSASPQLAPLAPMSMASEQGGSYSLIGMGSQYSAHSAIEKTNYSFGNGPAGLLSPLHLDGRRPHQSRQDFAGHVYIKEETDPMDNQSHHLMMGQQMPMSSQQQEMERIAQADTPPAVSNVELASTMIASLIGEQRSSSPSPHSYSGPPSASLMQQRLANMKHDTDESLEVHSLGDDRDNDYQRQVYAAQQSHKPRRIYSTKDSNDPLNAEIDEDIYIDTKELCKRIAFELKQHSIPQAIFAERILCRSQGTLSDLLRNPKPWNKLKSGRETFRRMFNWVQQPLSMRLGILDMIKTDADETGMNGISVVGGCMPKSQIGMAPPTPAQNVRHATRRISDGDGPSSKRPRLVFTDIQKRTLQAIFKETQRPSREMQQTIAEHLRLDLSTVANFFMNARRRSRIGPNQDEPQPYQQVRPVTPPPESPPRTGHGPRRRVPASMQHVEATVSSVAESAIQYSREAAAHDQMRTLDDDDDYKMYKDPLDDEAGISIVTSGQHDSYDNGGVDVVHCESLTPLGDSPVDVVDSGIIKQEEDGLGDEGTMAH